MKKDIIIELEDVWKAIILDSMQTGIDSGNGTFKEQGLVTRNGKSSFIWNAMNTEVKRALPTDRFNVIISRRGVWELILIYDSSTKIVYSLMKTARFEEVKKKYEKNSNLHYLEALCGINTPYLSETYEQLDLIGFAEEREEAKEEILIKMLSDIKDEVKKYVLITFEISKDKIILAQANVLSENLNIIEREQWQQYITPSYDAILAHISNTEAHEEDEDIIVSLKTNIQPFKYSKEENEDIELVPVTKQSEEMQ